MFEGSDVCLLEHLNSCILVYIGIKIQISEKKTPVVPVALIFLTKTGVDVWQYEPVGGEYSKHDYLAMR